MNKIEKIKMLRDGAYDVMYKKIISSINENVNWFHQIQGINVTEWEDCFTNEFRDGDFDKSNDEILLELNSEDFSKYIDFMIMLICDIKNERGCIYEKFLRIGK